MKGLTQKTEGKVFYVTPASGKLTLSSKTEKEGYVRKEFTNNQTKETIVKYVMEFDELTVYLRDAKKEETDYGLRWVVKGVNDDETYYLQFKYSSGYSRSFFNQLENVNLDKPVTITTSAKDEVHEGKTITSTALWISQDGKWVGFKYTKDNRGDLPEWKTAIVKGQEMKDDTDIQQYYEKVSTKLFNDLKLKLDTQVVEAFTDSEITGEEVTIPEGAMPKGGGEDLFPDDLPF